MSGSIKTQGREWMKHQEREPAGKLFTTFAAFAKSGSSRTFLELIFDMFDPGKEGNWPKNLYEFTCQ